MTPTRALSLTGIGPYLARSSSTWLSRASLHMILVPVVVGIFRIVNCIVSRYSTNLLSLHLFFLFLQRRHLLSLAQRVDGDGKEDVEQGVVAEQRQKDEVGAVHLAGQGQHFQTGPSFNIILITLMDEIIIIIIIITSTVIIIMIILTIPLDELPP